MQKPPFENNQIYHIYNRGVEKRPVFLEKNNYLRFSGNLFDFNNTVSVLPSNVRFMLRKPATANTDNLIHCLEVQLLNSVMKRKPLVEILAFCLLPNHFHLLLRQLTDGGIVKFMQKLGTGYTNYFNQKYDRVGSLFQGRFKATLIQKESHFLYMPYYIHLNPLDLIEPQWREGKINNVSKAIKFLENYRWSSFQDYIGKLNFPLVTQRNFLLKSFGKKTEYKRATMQWLKKMNFDNIQDLTLE